MAPAPAIPAIKVVKSSTTTAITAANQVVPYTFSVTNIGNVTLTGITVSDPNCTAAISGPAGDTNTNSQLDLTETWTYTCNHTVTQAELDTGGKLSNTVTADSTESASATATLNIPITQNPHLTLVKTATPATYDSAGDVIGYSYLLTNDGNVTLSGPFVVADDKATVTCAINQAPINPADVVLFDHFENATLASSTSGAPTFVDGPISFGHAIDFSSGAWLRYDVPGWYQWSGNYDPTGKEGSLDLWVYPKEYNVGLVNFNWFSAGSPPGSGYILHLGIDSNGKLTSSQWASISGPSLIQIPVGNTTIPLNQWTHVAYTWGIGGSRLFVNGVQDAFSPDNLYPALNSTFYVYVPYWGNPGIGYIDELRITKHSQSGFGADTLAPGASTTCTASYTITQADLDTGAVTNAAKAQGLFNGNDVFSNEDSETVTAVPSPELSLVKTATPTIYNSVGDVINYSYVVKNTGNVTLAGPVTMADDKATVTCPAGGLAPGDVDDLHGELHDHAGRPRRRLGDQQGHGDQRHGDLERGDGDGHCGADQVAVAGQDRHAKHLRLGW